MQTTDSNKYSIFRIFLFICKSNLAVLITVFISGLIQFGFSVTMPYLLSKITEFITNPLYYDKLVKFGILAIVMLIFIRVINFINACFIINLHNKSQYLLTIDIIKNVYSISLENMEKMDLVYLTKKLSNDVECLINMILKNCTSVIFNAFIIIFSLVSIFINSSTMGIFALISSILYLISYYFSKKILVQVNYELKENADIFYSRLHGFISNYLLIKVNSAFDYYNKLVYKSFKNVNQSSSKHIRIQWLFEETGNVIKYLMIAICLILACFSNSLSPEQLVLCAGYIWLYFASSQSYLLIASEFSGAEASLKRINSLGCFHNNNQETIVKNISSITVDNINFGFDNKVIISNFSFTFKPGIIYCISGKNGIGKSTFIELLLGLRRPSSGTIYINQTPIHTVILDHFYLNCVSYLIQDSEIMFNTVEKNIKYAIETNDENKYNYLVNEFNLESLTKIDEFNPNTLSGGQKQRIKLARAFYKNSDLLILDEPSTALDYKGIQTLKKIISEAKRNRIIIIVTHDSEIQSLADQNIFSFK